MILTDLWAESQAGAAGLGFIAAHIGVIAELRRISLLGSHHTQAHSHQAKDSDRCMHSSAFKRRVHSKHQSFDQMDNGDWGYLGRNEMTDPVTLNVGGHVYTTSLSTLTRYPDSMLGAMFRGDFPTARDSQGNYFIDRDGSLFRYVLNFLRTSELTLPVDFKEFDLLRKEADFFQIEPLIQCLNDPKPLYPTDTFEEVVELSSTRKLSKYSNPVAVIITQLTITTKVHALLEGIANHFTKWNKHMMDTRDCQVSFTFGPCDYHQEVSLRVHLMEYITKQGFTIRNTRVHHMSERANENTVEHNWTFCRLARKTDD
ncbi:BTB/POZ domain-containing protein KCTD6 [Dendrobates tinctorius]|uniref:BTB/POZ domain-containing protein KCTD6 n=2 Tax=Dendrobatinae TaxID=490054 RepID=UPI003CC9D176